MKLYPYQKKVLQQAIKLYETGDYVYLQMPTGTGKTITAFELLRKMDVDKVLWVVGSAEICAQTSRIAPDFISVVTWQFASRNKLSREYDCLVIDEVHYGGSDKHESRVFKHLVNKFINKQRLYISASPWDLDYKVLGDSFGRTASYYISDAYKDGNIPNLQIHQLRCGNKLEVLDCREEVKLQMEHLETLDDEELLRFVKAHSFDMGDFHSIRGILRNRIDSLINEYMKDYKGESAILFTPNTSMIEYAVSILEKNHIPTSFVSYLEKDISKKVSAFRASSGKVMVVCNMLNFGFDMPSLKLAMDASFSKENTRRNYQKVGRLLRMYPGKDLVTYIYTRDFANISDEDCTTSVDLMRILYCDRQFLQKKSIEFGEGSIPGDKVSFSHVLFADGTEDYGLESLSNLIITHYKHFPEEKKRLLLAMAAKGERRPSCKNPKSAFEAKLGLALQEYTCKSRETFDLAFTTTIKEIAPASWWVRADEKRAILLELASIGKKLSSYRETGYGGFTFNQLKNAFDSYTRVEKGCWDSEFLREFIRRSPTLLGSRTRVLKVRASLEKEFPGFLKTLPLISLVTQT